MPQMVYFVDKIAFWRGTKRFTDGQRNTVETQRNSERVERKRASDGASDASSRVVNATNNPADVGASASVAKTGK